MIFNMHPQIYDPSRIAQKTRVHIFFRLVHIYCRPVTIRLSATLRSITYRPQTFMPAQVATQKM